MDKDEICFPQWNFKIMLLRELHKKPLSNWAGFRIDVFKKLLGKLEIILAEFTNLGLIRITSFTEAVNSTMTINQLKEFLKSKKAKTVGKKDDLVARASNLFSNSEKSLIEENGYMYILTTQGWEIVNSGKERFQKELTNFENDVVSKVVKGEIENACKIVSDFFASYPFPIGMGGDWSTGFNEKFRATVYHIMKSDYLTKSMNISYELNIKLRAIISANYLFSFMDFSKKSVAGKILLVYEDFKCEPIEKFLNETPTGIFRSYDSESLSDVVEIFNHTIVNYSLNQVMLEQVLEGRGKNRYKGVEIIEGNKDICRYCSGKIQEYEWENLKILPLLPRYPGCICMYEHFFEKYE